MLNSFGAERFGAKKMTEILKEGKETLPGFCTQNHGRVLRMEKIYGSFFGWGENSFGEGATTLPRGLNAVGK